MVRWFAALRMSILRRNFKEVPRVSSQVVGGLGLSHWCHCSSKLFVP